MLDLAGRGRFLFRFRPDERYQPLASSKRLGAPATARYRRPRSAPNSFGLDPVSGGNGTAVHRTEWTPPADSEVACQNPLRRSLLSGTVGPRDEHGDLGRAPKPVQARFDGPIPSHSEAKHDCCNKSYCSDRRSAPPDGLVPRKPPRVSRVPVSAQYRADFRTTAHSLSLSQGFAQVVPAANPALTSGTAAFQMRPLP